MVELKTLSIAADILRRMGRDIRCRNFADLVHFRDAMKYGSLLKGWTNNLDGLSMNYQTSRKRMRMHVNERFLVVTLYSLCYGEGRLPIFVCEIQDGVLVRAEVVEEARACVRVKPERLNHVLKFVIPAIGEEAFYAVVDTATQELLKLAQVGAVQRTLDNGLMAANLAQAEGKQEACDIDQLDDLIAKHFPAHVRRQSFTCDADHGTVVLSRVDDT